MTRSQRPAMQAEAGAIGERPAEPRRREREGGSLRTAGHFVRRNQLCEFGANAVMERVPCRQNAYVLVSAGEDQLVGFGEWAGPDCGLGPDRRSQRKVTRAANHEVGAVESRKGPRRQPGTAVLANSDDRQP